MNDPMISSATAPLALVSGRIVLPDRVVDGRALLVADSKIVAVAAPDELAADTARLDVGGRLVTPGLVDIHTHGALGHTFNEPTAEAFATITAENLRRGVTSLLATTATAPIDDLVACLEFARGWMAAPQAGGQVLGVHLEGPYFHPARAGAQDPAALRTPDDGSVDRLLAHADVVRMMSYAPELPGGLDLTRRLARLGIVPAAGHSNARDTDVEAARSVVIVSGAAPDSLWGPGAAGAQPATKANSVEYMTQRAAPAQMPRTPAGNSRSRRNSTRNSGSESVDSAVLPRRTDRTDLREAVEAALD